MRRHGGSYMTSTAVGSPASCSYARCTCGVSRATSCARASPKAPPDCANFSSHTSSVEVMSSVSRPPACFNNTLRCRTIRSTSSLSASLRGASDTSASSSSVRRNAGPSYTSCKSLGANTVVRATPSKSRMRCNRCLLTSTRLRPARLISHSIVTSRPSFCRTFARMYAESTPSRTSASFWTPRKLDSVAR